MGAEWSEVCPVAGKGFDESESDSSLSPCAGAECKSAEPPQKASEFGESVAEGEA